MAEKVTWTKADAKQLEALERRYAPRGVRTLASEVDSLNASVRSSKGEGRDAARRAFWQTHKQITGADMEALRTLHQKACKARLIESDEVSTLNQALTQRLITESEHRARVDSISSHVLNGVRRRAHDLIATMDEAETHATFASTATDEDKTRVVAKFNAIDAWSQALARFREVYAAADIERKVELQRDCPELYQTAIGGR